MNIFLCRRILLSIIPVFLFSCDPLPKNRLNTPTIKAGITRITGKIIDFNNIKNEDILVYITTTQPVTGENIQYKAQVDKSGDFYIEVDIETNLSVCGIYSDINPLKSLLIALEEGKETKIEIVYNIEKVDVVNDFKFTSNDMIYSLGVMDEMITYRSEKPRKKLYEKDVEYFLNHGKKVLEERLKIANSNPYLSENARKIVAKDFSLFLYSPIFLAMKKK